MTQPPFLQSGDKVAIVAPAGKLQSNSLNDAISYLESWELTVQGGPFLYAEHFNFAGTDEQRKSDIQKALDDTSIKAIFCARGGYGSNRVIDELDFTLFSKHPKWIIGFSDNTLLLNHVSSVLGMHSIHGPMPITFNKDKTSTDLLRQKLFGTNPLTFSFSPNCCNRNGECTGQIIGGNLTILSHLIATASEPNFENSILFIEDIDEYLYALDRTLISLKRTSSLSKIKGLLVGDFSFIKDNEIPFGKNIQEIVLDVCSDLDIPIAFNIPCGHESVNYPLTIGGNYSLKVDGTETLLKEVID